MGSDYLLFKQSVKNSLVEAEFSLTNSSKFLPLYMTLLGQILGISLYLRKNTMKFTIKLPLDNKLNNRLYLFFNNKYYIDIIYNKYINNKSLLLGNILNKQVDRGIVEKLGPFGITQSMIEGSMQIQRFFIGNIPQYALYIIIGIITIIFVVFNTVLRVEYILLIMTICTILLKSMFILIK